jgi:asparagine synthase (glutamine-hydrolysing)
MCGILGGINIDKEVLVDALPLLSHRGPDDQGYIFFDNVGLLHTRLSIQDLVFGKQPFCYNGLTLIFNGEVYNHIELRKKYDLNCTTNSDAETFIKLYERNGIESLHEVDGMFAFAIFDQRKRTLVLARDRAGKKPLYYFCRDGKLAFSSELNALGSIAAFGINYQNINQYLRYCFTGSSTPYQDIFELEAGSYITVDIDNLRLQYGKWWSILDFYQRPLKSNIHDALEILDSLLNKSVSIRLSSSDLEVGAFLSGGIDSGLITSIASRYVSKLKTFTVAFDGQYDESKLAELVSRKYDTEHNLIRISFNQLSTDIENILSKYGEPFGDSSAIPSYYVSREAKKYLTVTLNGDGADELFAGYRRYVPFAWYDFLSPERLFRGFFRNVTSVLPFPDEKQSKYNYIYRLSDLAGKDPLQSYLSSTVDTFEGYENMLISGENPFNDLNNFVESMNVSQLSGLQKIMCIDFEYQLPNDLLEKMDIATMANSLEGRSPFLSKDILEFAPSLNDNFKIKGLTTKYILRELAKKYLPNEIVVQPKRGFEVPLKKWMETDLREMVNDYLSGATFSEEFVKKQFIRELLENKASVAPEKRAKMLWYMLALEIWYRKCYLHE